MKHLIKPGLHRFDGMPWAWVRYTELLGAVGNIEDGYPVDKMNAFSRLFGWLDQSKDPGRLLVVVYDPKNTSFELAHPDIKPGADNEDFLRRYVEAVYTVAALNNGIDANTKRLLDYLYVPAGFSNDVLEHVTFEWTGYCPHHLVSRRDYRVGCSDAGCGGGEHYCHTVVEQVCDRCGEVIEEQKI